MRRCNWLTRVYGSITLSSRRCCRHSGLGQTLRIPWWFILLVQPRRLLLLPLRTATAHKLRHIKLDEVNFKFNE